MVGLYDMRIIEQHVNRRERLHMYGYDIRFVLCLCIDADTANWIAPCSVSNRNGGNIEYDVKGRCFPNNLVAF